MRVKEAGNLKEGLISHWKLCAGNRPRRDSFRQGRNLRSLRSEWRTRRREPS